MDKITEAIILASKAFDGKKRKGSKAPSILHSLEVCSIAQTLTDDLDVVIACILHDTIEDTDVTKEEIKQKFGQRVYDLVMAETENKRIGESPLSTWKIRKVESIESLKNTNDLGIKAMYLSDKLSNLRSLYEEKIKIGDNVWNAFNQKDPNEHKWYYESVLEQIGEFKGTYAYQSYIELFNKLFKENK